MTTYKTISLEPLLLLALVLPTTIGRSTVGPLSTNHPVLPVGITTARRQLALGLRLGLLWTLEAVELAMLVITMERL